MVETYCSCRDPSSGFPSFPSSGDWTGFPPDRTLHTCKKQSRLELTFICTIGWESVSSNHLKVNVVMQAKEVWWSSG